MYCIVILIQYIIDVSHYRSIHLQNQNFQILRSTLVTDVHVYLCTYVTLISTRMQHCRCKASLLRNTCLSDRHLSAFDKQMSHRDRKQWHFLSKSIGALKRIMLVSVSVSVNPL